MTDKKAHTILGLIILCSLIMNGWGMFADLPHSRMPTEVLHIKLAVKFGSGQLNPHCFGHPSCLGYFLCFVYGMIFLFGLCVEFIVGDLNATQVVYAGLVIFGLIIATIIIFIFRRRIKRK